MILNPSKASAGGITILFMMWLSRRSYPPMVSTSRSPVRSQILRLSWVTVWLPIAQDLCHHSFRVMSQTSCLVDGLPSDTITVDIPLPSGTCGCGFSNHAQLGIVVRELEVPRPESNSSVFYGRLAPAGAIAGLMNDIISGLAPRLPDLCVEWFGGSAGCWATCCKSWDGRLCLASRIQETRCSAADPGSCQR